MTALVFLGIFFFGPSSVKTILSHEIGLNQTFYISFHTNTMNNIIFFSMDIRKIAT